MLSMHIISWTLQRHADCCRRVEVMIQLLGLQRCADTVIGDAMLRGVSGGERKRVTSAGGCIENYYIKNPLVFSP
jgi:ABC-type multidrug transport system ATPase subunit